MSDTTMDGQFELLVGRLRTLLPEQYAESLENIAPTPMGSAALKFKGDGSVAWDEMWSSFCNLAMAGGPPHRGTLLEPGTPEAIAEQPGRYRQGVEEVCRGLALVTSLEVAPARALGWVRVECTSAAMAGWLLRAITMENVSVRGGGSILELPVGPDYRLEKEIKNVVTVVAKTCHYWRDHMSTARRGVIADLLHTMSCGSTLLQPTSDIANQREPQAEQHRRMTKAFGTATGLVIDAPRYVGWFGIQFPSVTTAVWMLRMMIVSNVLSRREETVLFLPIDGGSDPHGRRVIEIFSRVYSIALEEGVVRALVS